MLQDMKDEYGLTLLFISHDLSVVKNVSDRVAVMYLGKICEIGDGDVIYDNPAHPYTRLLLAAIPDPENKHASDDNIAAPPMPSDPAKISDLPKSPLCEFLDLLGIVI